MEGMSSRGVLNWTGALELLLNESVSSRSLFLEDSSGERENKSEGGRPPLWPFPLLDALQVLLVLVESSLEVLHDHLLELVSRNGLRDPLSDHRHACLLPFGSVVVEGLRACKVSLHILQ